MRTQSGQLLSKQEYKESPTRPRTPAERRHNILTSVFRATKQAKGETVTEEELNALAAEAEKASAPVRRSTADENKEGLVDYVHDRRHSSLVNGMPKTTGPPISNIPPKPVNTPSVGRTNTAEIQAETDKDGNALTYPNITNVGSNYEFAPRSSRPTSKVDTATRTPSSAKPSGSTDPDDTPTTGGTAKTVVVKSNAVSPSNSPSPFNASGFTNARGTAPRDFIENTGGWADADGFAHARGTANTASKVNTTASPKSDVSFNTDSHPPRRGPRLDPGNRINTNSTSQTDEITPAPAKKNDDDTGNPLIRSKRAILDSDWSSSSSSESKSRPRKLQLKRGNPNAASNVLLHSYSTASLKVNVDAEQSDKRTKKAEKKARKKARRARKERKKQDEKLRKERLKQSDKGRKELEEKMKRRKKRAEKAKKEQLKATKKANKAMGLRVGKKAAIKRWLCY